MSENDPAVTPLGEQPNDIDQSVTVTDTDEAEVAEATGDGACPVIHAQPHPTNGSANQVWWPNKLNLKILAKNPVAHSKLTFSPS